MIDSLDDRVQALEDALAFFIGAAFSAEHIGVLIQSARDAPAPEDLGPNVRPLKSRTEPRLRRMSDLALVLLERARDMRENHEGRRASEGPRDPAA